MTTALSSSGRTAVVYEDVETLWAGFEDLVRDLASAERARAVAELGGGADPIIGDWDFVKRRTVFDISATALASADINLQTRLLDLCQPIPDDQSSYDLGRYDLVFSKMLCEHLVDARTFHQNCFKLLRPGGLAVHFFPTLSALPFVVNKLAPEPAARSVAAKFLPDRRDDPNWQKRPAYYRWTTGPTRRARRRFESIGFRVEAWRAGFGHHYYRAHAALDAAERVKSDFLLKHPVPGLTSFATVVLRKPA
ncbi:MAG: methyltransferase domain-containing protein [Mycobacterium sp.]